MIDTDGYKVWTAAFMEGCYFSGSWEKGEKIQFLAPIGDGITAVIEENRPYEHISIRHLGEVSAGVEDTTSAKVVAWAPAYEKYSYADSGGGTEVTVSLDTVAEYERYMLETYPKALGLLKALCEAKAKSATPHLERRRPGGGKLTGSLAFATMLACTSKFLANSQRSRPLLWVRVFASYRACENDGRPGSPVTLLVGRHDRTAWLLGAQHEQSGSLS